MRLTNFLKSCLFCLAVLQGTLLFAQYEKKNLEAVAIEKPPRIDGFLDDECWQNVPVATGFINDKPNPGVPQGQPTEVKVLYTQDAMYIGVMCYDSAPDSILTQLSGRDVLGNSDYCGVTFSCYRDGINGFTFITTPKGEQWDARMTGDNEDESWNAVWYCKARVVESGWVAEFRIPFAAIRFPDKPEQLWNINFIREVRRTRHHAEWNGVNPLVPGFLTQMGTLSGIRNISPPRRIFFYPYSSAYYNTTETVNGEVMGSFSYNAGLDLKLGLSDAFTLDATLVPDFGQTISDQQVLNLSAFELQFTDNRQFFTEGTELFSKAGIFYSRRIGFEAPMHYYDVESKLGLDEKLIDNPSRDQIVNAIKISGRDKSNLGVGFFNAVTTGTNALVVDTLTGIQRKVKTSSLTNYNVFVLDQILPNNSYISLINTSVLRAGDDYDVDVLGTEYEIRNKENTFSIGGSGAMSTKYGRTYSGPEVKDDNGFRQTLTASKISGNWTANIGQYSESDTYDPTDLGFLQANNSFGYWISNSYNIYEPFGRFNNLWSNLNISYNKLYKPNTFTDFSIYFDGGLNTRKFNTWGLEAEAVPFRGYDYFEPRVWGRVFRTYRYNMIGGWFSSDYRKKIAVDMSTYFTSFENRDRYRFSWRLAPRFRFNDHLFVTYVYSYQSHLNDIGFAYNFEDENETMPLFGSRDVISHTNVLSVQYAFTPVMTLNTRVRHYWGFTRFSRFYSLDSDGYLGNADATAPDQSFNSFTIDMIYSWIFKPGSEISIVWKNAIINYADEVPTSLSNDFDYTMGLPQNNSYSVKLIYFLDYHSVAGKLSRKKELNG